MSSNNSPGWTEPPWTGWIETTGDALLILEAARRGLIPRVTRRLVDSERKMITSGSVFVFDEDESGIKRWTDGFFWSPSRILGNFLIYRETDKRGSGHRGRAGGGSGGNMGAGPVDETAQPAQYEYNVEGVKPEAHSLSRPKGDGVDAAGINKQRERALLGSLTNSYKFKSDGMMKKTFSLTINNVAQHLVSYYKIEDVEAGRLRAPSSLPELAALDISAEYLDKTHFRCPPKVEVGIDGVPRYRGEADDVDTSHHGPHAAQSHAHSTSPRVRHPAVHGAAAHLAGPGEAGPSGSGDGEAKRKERFAPYASPSAGGGEAKKKRKAARGAEVAGYDAAQSVPQAPQYAAYPPPGGPGATSSVAGGASTGTGGAYYHMSPGYPPHMYPSPNSPAPTLHPAHPQPQPHALPASSPAGPTSAALGPGTYSYPPPAPGVSGAGTAGLPSAPSSGPNPNAAGGGGASAESYPYYPLPPGATGYAPYAHAPWPPHTHPHAQHPHPHAQYGAYGPGPHGGHSQQGSGGSGERDEEDGE